MIVAETAWDGRAPGKVLLNKRTHDVALEPVLVIDHVIRDTDSLGDAPRVIDVVKRTAATGDSFRHAITTSQATLVPQLHGQADKVVPLGAQHGRNGRGVNSSRHGDGDGLRLFLLIEHSALSNQRSAQMLSS